MKQLKLCLFIALIQLGCQKEENAPLDHSKDYCKQMQSALLIGDPVDSYIIRTIINYQCLQFPPKPTPVDPIGHSDNLDSLIQMINSDCSEFQLKKKCYACLESGPPQSIIEISFQANGLMVKKRFYLTAPFDNFMIMRG